MLSLSGILLYRDTQSAKKSLVIFSRIVPLLIGIDAYHGFLSNSLINSLFACIKIPYHNELHADIVQVLTSVYILLQDKRAARECICQAVGISTDLLCQMESEFDTSMSTKEKCIHMRNFLLTIPEVLISPYY